MAGVDAGVVGQGEQPFADALKQGVPVAARQVGAPDVTTEQRVSGEQAPRLLVIEGDAAGRMSRHGDDPQPLPSETDGVTVVELCRGVWDGAAQLDAQLAASVAGDADPEVIGRRRFEAASERLGDERRPEHVVYVHVCRHDMANLPLVEACQSRYAGALPTIVAGWVNDYRAVRQRVGQKMTVRHKRVETFRVYQQRHGGVSFFLCVGTYFSFFPSAKALPTRSPNCI